MKITLAIRVGNALSRNAGSTVTLNFFATKNSKEFLAGGSEMEYPCVEKKSYCGPRISIARCVSHSNGELDFFIWKIDFYLIKKKNDLESPLIFVFFFLKKGKQNKKEKP